MHERSGQEMGRTAPTPTQTRFNLHRQLTRTANPSSAITAATGFLRKPPRGGHRSRTGRLCGSVVASPQPARGAYYAGSLWVERWTGGYTGRDRSSVADQLGTGAP